jgi:hypothetical protein
MGLRPLRCAACSSRLALSGDVPDPPERVLVDAGRDELQARRHRARRGASRPTSPSWRGFARGEVAARTSIHPLLRLIVCGRGNTVCNTPLPARWSAPHMALMATWEVMRQRTAELRNRSDGGRRANDQSEDSTAVTKSRRKAIYTLRRFPGPGDRNIKSRLEDVEDRFSNDAIHSRYD